MSESRRRGGLRRELGPLSATPFTAGMMVGIGIFAAFGAATEAAGSGILLAMLLGGSVAFATGMSATNLGINDPTEGGAFTWARDFDHETLGFIAGCGYLGKNLVSMSVIALAFATYLARVVPGIPEHLVAAGAVLAIMGLNLFGIRLTSKLLIGLLAIDVGLLALYGGASLHAFDAGHLAPVLGDKGLGFFAGAAIFFWTWDGFMRMGIMASEVKQPQRTIPIAIVGGITIAAVTYIGDDLPAFVERLRRAREILLRVDAEAFREATDEVRSAHRQLTYEDLSVALEAATRTPNTDESERTFRDRTARFHTDLAALEAVAGKRGAT